MRILRMMMIFLDCMILQNLKKPISVCFNPTGTWLGENLETKIAKTNVVISPIVKNAAINVTMSFLL